MSLIIRSFSVFLFFTLSFFSVAQQYSIADIPPELIKNANSVLLDEYVEVDVSKPGKMITRKKQVWAVLNARGNDDPDLWEAYDGNSKVKKIEAVIYDAAGKKKAHFKKKDFSDVSRSGYSTMYSDSRVLFKKYTSGAYPYIVVFQSETETGDTAFIFPWHPLRGYYESTRKSVLEIKFDPANKVRYKSENLEGHDIVINETPNSISFSANNLRAIRYEEHAPAFASVFPIAYFGMDEFYLKGKKGSAQSWNDFGKWMFDDLLSDVQHVPETTLNTIKILIAGETTNEGKARKIYHYLQNKVRYINISIGIGGWKPMSAADVDKLSYGDCKALTNYTKAILDAVGVPSYYTIIYADNAGRDIMEDFVSIQGNHIILGIPDGDAITWLECTSQDVPYGYIGRLTEDRDALMITPQGAEIVRTKIYTTPENLQQSSGQITVSPSGKITAALKRTSEGIQYESKFLLPNRKKDEIDTFYKEEWNYINGFTITENQLIDDQENILFTEEIELETTSYMQKVSDGYLLIPNMFNRTSYIPPKTENRKQQLKIHSGFTDKDEITIAIPVGYEAMGLWEAVELNTTFGFYKNSIIQENDKLVYVRELQIEKGLYAPEEYENYREFLRTIGRLDQTKILFQTIK